MGRRKGLLPSCLLTLASFLTGLTALPSHADATKAGNNAICTTASNCTLQAPSAAFIDANKANLQNTNFCAAIFGVINAPSYPTTGTVIDARGITNLSCTTGQTPWFISGVFLNKPSTVLLPAGVLTIRSTWILPGGTKLIGQGTTTVTNPGGAEETTIRACSPSCFSGSSMIQLGQPCPGSECTGSAAATAISVENLTLDGNNLTVTGILNSFSEDQTYVDHVTLYQILGKGLYITGAAQNSGPYTNITYDTNGVASSTAACVQIRSVGGGTRGIRGLTCRSGSYSPAAILLDSSNNSIHDVRIMGFDDGVLVGSQAAAQGNVLINILGDTDRISPAPINVVHISTNSTVTDLSITGVANQGVGAYTVQDDQTSPGVPIADSHVALYVLGRSPATGVYSRFTTSPSAATWAFGIALPPTGTCAPGSLYSNTIASSGALYVCVFNGSQGAWQPVTLH